MVPVGGVQRGGLHGDHTVAAVATKQAVEIVVAGCELRSKGGEFLFSGFAGECGDGVALGRCGEDAFAGFTQASSGFYLVFQDEMRRQTGLKREPA